VANTKLSTYSPANKKVKVIKPNKFAISPAGEKLKTINDN
jgi:hypothetical protein